MRLLNVHTLKFETRPNKQQRPKYAIASHRWSDGAEATLKDLQKERNTHKAGYQKVKSFAKYIREHIPSTEWLWIDTCCINQDSSAELHEAINSMFQWYQEAEVCLAYLSDATEEITSFEQSVWFTRGWTLQELLAPALVIFLDQDWQLIGHKGSSDGGRGSAAVRIGPSLHDLIATITGIPESILEDYNKSHSQTIDEKLLWMNNRQTSRGEDSSYCLLGILGVSMNIRYGDGKNRTRTRLLKKAHSQMYTALIHSCRPPDDLLELDPELDSPPGPNDVQKIVLGSAGLEPLAIELAEDSRVLKRLYKLAGDPSSSLLELADELSMFAHAVQNIENHRHHYALADQALVQPCIQSFFGAGQRLRSLVKELELTLTNSNAQRDAKAREIFRLEHKLHAAKSSLAVAHQLYIDRAVQPSNVSPFKALDDFTGNSAGHSPALTHFEAVASPRTDMHYDPRSGRAKQKWRLRITPWFFTKTWEISLNFTWSFSTLTLVPFEAPIIQACLAGDLPTVQALFQRGEASPYDYSQGEAEDAYSFQSSYTVLSAAARSGNIELCQFLVQVAGFPAVPSGHASPLDIYSCSRHRRYDVQSFRFLIQDPALNDIREKITDGQISKYLYLWTYDPSSLNSIADALFMSWEARVEWAFNGVDIYQHHTAAAVIAMLGYAEVNSKIAMAKDRQGRTFLHVIADYYCYDSAYPENVVEVVSRLIQGGADLHAQTDKARTPLMASFRLTSYSPGLIVKSPRPWLDLLERAGADLETYGRREVAIWKASAMEGINDKLPLLKYSVVKYGPRVQDWAVSVRRVVEIHTYRHNCPPGTWSSSDISRVTSICWHPAEEDTGGQWFWEKTGQLIKYSSSVVYRVCDPKSWDRILGHTGWNTMYDSYMTDQDLGSQDDCGHRTLMWDRCTRSTPHARSHSMPARLIHHETGNRPNWSFEPYRGWHMCMFDGRRRLGRPCSARNCAKGIHFLSGNYEALWFKVVGRNMDIFCRLARLGKLQSLPYNGYGYWQKADFPIY